ncbi:MAG: hypothetical protein ACO1RX_12495 [Candidatus Sericytochromatia bacterium]
MRHLLIMCATSAMLMACTPGVTPNTPAAINNPTSTPESNTAASSSVTASRQAYGAYLTCMQTAHPDSSIATLADIVLNVYTDDMWPNLRAVADTQVKTFTKTYGKKCGA